jgi:hypothetical protein
MHINKRQKIATAIITPLFALAVLFPPWRAVFFDQSVSWAPLWSPPPKAPMVVSYILWEWLGIFVLLAIVLLVLRTRGTPHEHRTV